MYKFMVQLADMARNFREAADVIDEIIELKMTIEAKGSQTKKEGKRLQELVDKYEDILERNKEWG